MTRAIRSIAAMVIMVTLCAVFVPAQEKISPVSDYQYKKDYAQYEGIRKEADPQKRADLLVAFMKEHPISRMLSYVAADYLECVKPHIVSKNWAKAIQMEEALLALMPTEKSVQDAAVPEPGAGEFLKNVLAPTQKTVRSALMAAYFQANNLPKAAEMGESMYAAAPDKAVAASLAEIYFKMQNYDKYLQYGDKVLAEFPMDQVYGIALQMAQVYLQKQDVAKAGALYTKLLNAFGDKVPPGMQEPAWNATRAVAYGLMAAGAYGQKDYPKTVDLYQKVAQLDPKRDDAYYFIGMCKWNSKDPDGAIDYFAKAAVLGKTYSKKAQDYLDQLWKARHPENPAGVEEVKTKAKTELGLK